MATEMLRFHGLCAPCDVQFALGCYSGSFSSFVLGWRCLGFRVRNVFGRLHFTGFFIWSLLSRFMSKEKEVLICLMWQLTWHSQFPQTSVPICESDDVCLKLPS